MKTNIAIPLSFAAALALLAALPGAAQPSSGQRWYQIELSIFTHETGERDMERWPDQDLELDFPDDPRRLRDWMEVLDLPDWTLLQETSGEEDPREPGGEAGAFPQASDPMPRQETGFKLPDPERDPFVRLPESEQNFQDTNRRLESSPSHRLLFHAAWRQPIPHQAGAVPLAVAAGRSYGERHELEGSLAVYFNPSESRVILDSNLWLTEFTSGSASPFPGSLLPPLPASLQEEDDSGDGVSEERYRPQRVMPMRQTRGMRSNEFHYLDHPALGIVVEVFPYELPDPPENPQEPPSLPRRSL